MICKLCQKEKELTKSHIIPKVFFDFLYTERNEGSLIMVGKNKHNKRRPVGSYEKLLCTECEQMLGVYDDYAQGLLLKKPLKFYPDVEKLAYLIGTYDYAKLKLFFLSLLWRSSIASLEEFGHIDVGSFESRLKELILSQSVGKDDEFSVFITRFDSNDEKIKFIVKRSIMLPAKQKIDGINYSVFYLSNGYKIYIKVDKRSSIDIYRKFILKNNHSLVILRLDNFENSPEYKILLDMVKR
ncbi:MAG: hypothetical protein WAV31_02910 [Candidatus Moraniibacteriota bacterium]